MHLLHDGVAGVDAQAALNAAKLRALADIDACRTDCDALAAIDAIAGRRARRARGRRLFERHARLAAIITIGDVQRIFVGQRGLNARPWAGVQTDLFAHPAGENISGEGEYADPEIGFANAGLERGEIIDEGRRVREIENPDAARPPGDENPDEVLGDLLADFLEGPGTIVEPDAVAGVALDPALRRHEEIGPNRLRTHIAAPDAARERVHQKQRERGEDQQAGEVIDFLRPDLDEEEVEAAVREIHEHRLTRRVRSAMPAHERQEIIDGQRRELNAPFDAAEVSVDLLGINPVRFLDDRFVQKRLVGVCAGHYVCCSFLPVPAPILPRWRGRGSRAWLSSAKPILRVLTARRRANGHRRRAP